MPKEQVQNQKPDENKEVLKVQNFPVSHVRIERCSHRKKPLMVVRVSSKALAIILRSAAEEIRRILPTCPTEVKAGYLRGLYEAEGSVPDRRRVTLSMKDLKEIQFAKKLLSDLGLCEGVALRKRPGGMWVLEIYRRKNIEKFQKAIGFGHHSIRNNRIKHILSLYSYDYFSARERNAQVRNIIEENSGKVTAAHVAKKLGISYQHACYLLTSLTEKGELKVNKLMRPYTYSINSGVDAKNHPT
jgi:predicted transcriptional regulator